MSDPQFPSPTCAPARQLREAPRKIVALFHKQASGRLELSLVTTIQGYRQNQYNVGWSNRYGYIFDLNGSGGGVSVPVDGIYYASSGVLVEENPNTLISPTARRRNKTRRLSRVPAKFRCDDGDILSWLEQHGIQDTSVWCSECRDHVTGEYLCEHTWWCSKTGWYSTPSERCGCLTIEDCEDG